MSEREAAQQATVMAITKMADNLARSRDLLTREQQFFLAELLRDTADVLDRGRAYRPATTVIRRLV
jgi:hypothetical protein